MSTQYSASGGTYGWVRTEIELISHVISNSKIGGDRSCLKVILRFRHDII
jgi:hypothetical protein